MSKELKKGAKAPKKLEGMEPMGAGDVDEKPAGLATGDHPEGADAQGSGDAGDVHHHAHHGDQTHHHHGVQHHTHIHLAGDGEGGNIHLNPYAGFAKSAGAGHGMSPIHSSASAGSAPAIPKKFSKL